MPECIRLLLFSIETEVPVTYKRNGPATESGYTDIYEHIDDGRKTHRERTQEQGLSRMANHSHPYIRIKDVPQDRNSQEKQKQKHVQTEYDDRKPVQPPAIVRKIVEKYRHYPSPHVDREPRRGEVSQDTPPPSIMLF